jgi:hypothetical protein
MRIGLAAVLVIRLHGQSRVVHAQDCVVSEWKHGPCSVTCGVERATADASQAGSCVLCPHGKFTHNKTDARQCTDIPVVLPSRFAHPQANRDRFRAWTVTCAAGRFHNVTAARVASLDHCTSCPLGQITTTADATSCETAPTLVLGNPRGARRRRSAAHRRLQGFKLTEHNDTTGEFVPDEITRPATGCPAGRFRYHVAGQDEGFRLSARTVLTQPSVFGRPCPSLMKGTRCGMQPCPVDCQVDTTW